jgi:xanthine dehydrogenase accessory factor
MTDDSDDATPTPTGTEDAPEAPESRDAAASPERVDRLAARYAEQGRPFARVTVVRREPPVSAHVGDRAVVTADGDLTGWIGGAACAQSVVVREARTALRTGEPKLIGIAPDPDAVDRPGLEAFPMTCHSQGTLELFVEPVTSPARLVVVGDSPMAASLARLAGGLSVDVTAVTPDGDPLAGADESHAAPDDVTAMAELLAGATWVVAASTGTTDDVAVAGALAAEVPYVGLVASRRRADELAERVADWTGRDAGAVRAAVRSPAGLDIGARTPEEVGVSVLAELVAVRRSGELSGDASTATGASDDGAPVASGDGDGDGTMAGSGADDGATAGSGDGDAAEPTVVTDPVCGMDVTVGAAAATTTHDGETYHFCGEGCRDAFVDDPDRFVGRVEQ